MQSKVTAGERFPASRSGALALLALALIAAAGVARAAGELDYGLAEHRLARIVIDGNAAFGDGQLKSVLKIREPRSFHPLMLVGIGDRTARYRPDLLDNELGLLERYYRQRGFHQVAVRLDSVATEPVGGDVIYITIAEGSRTFLAELSFPGGEAIPAELLAEGLKYAPGDPAPADNADLGADIYELRTKFWEEGFLRVRITPELTVTSGETDDVLAARLSYHIRPGLRYAVRRVRIEGRGQTRPGLIDRELQLKPGDRFRWSAVQATQRRLLDTALFRDVTLIPADIDTVAGLTDILVQVVERRPAYFEFGAGVGTRERIRLLGGWGHNNLAGRGQRLRLSAKIALNYEDVQRLAEGTPSPELNYRYDIRHTWPHAIGRFQLEAGLYAEKETRGESGLNLMNTGYDLGTRFRGGRHVLNLLRVQVVRSNPELHPDAKPTLREAFEAVDLSSSTTRSLTWDLLRERRDDPVRPAGGSLITTQLQGAGGPLGGDNSFVKGQASWHAYRSTPLGGVLAFRVSGGVVRAYGASRDRGSESVPYNERFFAGGVSTVRGYLERSLGPQYTDPALLDSLQLASDVPLPDRPARGGNYMLLTNVEWRFPMPLVGGGRVGGVFFLDGGNVWERARGIRLRGFRMRSYPREPEDETATKLWDYRWSTGVGLRVDTPVGPVRLDVGFPLKRARLSATETEDEVLYHFSLGYPF